MERENPCRVGRFPRRGPPEIGRTRTRQAEERPPYSERQDAPQAAGRPAAGEASDRKREPVVPDRARVRTLAPIRVRARLASAAFAELLPQASPWSWELEFWRQAALLESAEPLPRGSRPPRLELLPRQYEILPHAQAALGAAGRQKASRAGEEPPPPLAREPLRAGWPTRQTSPLRALLPRPE